MSYLIDVPGGSDVYTSPGACEPIGRIRSFQGTYQCWDIEGDPIGSRRTEEEAHALVDRVSDEQAAREDEHTARIAAIMAAEDAQERSGIEQLSELLTLD